MNTLQPNIDEKPPKRPCLGCQKGFQPKHNLNFMCDICNKNIRQVM